MPYPIDPNATVALAVVRDSSAWVNGQARTSYSYSPAKDDSAVGDGPGRVIGGAATGALHGAVGGFLYCGLAFFICVPLFAVSGAVLGGAAGLAAGSGQYSSASEEDVAPVDKSSVGRTVPVEPGRDQRALAWAESTHRPLHEWIRDYARDGGLGELASLSPSTSPSSAEKADYSGKADFVFEIALPSLSQSFSDDPERWNLEIAAKGRLVRVDDGMVVSRFSMKELSESAFVTASLDEERLAKELDDAMERLGKGFVDHWIAPSMAGRTKDAAVAPPAR